MATCPRCGEFLSEHHHCEGVWRRLLGGLSVALVGALLGVSALLIADQRSSDPLIIVTALLGAVVAWSFWQYVWRI